jgi:hypothetical protein
MCDLNENKNASRIFVCKRDDKEDLDIGGRKILKWILDK